MLPLQAVPSSSKPDKRAVPWVCNREITSGLTAEFDCSRTFSIASTNQGETWSAAVDSRDCRHLRVENPIRRSHRACVLGGTRGASNADFILD